MKKGTFGSLSRIGVAVLTISTFILCGRIDAGVNGGIESLKKTGKAFAEIAKKVSPAVVNVKSMGEQRRSPFGGYNQGEPPLFFFGPDGPFMMPKQPQRREKSPHKKRFPIGAGSGFIISADGYVLTNNHVIDQADEVSVTLNDGREFKAKIVGKDPKSDVAVLKIDGNNLPTAQLGDSDSLEVGEWVLAVGNPFGLSNSITAGIVSAKGRSGVGLADYENFIQTDAAINPGNSGGPLVNLDGHVVGINSAIFSRSGGYMGIGFAIPVNMAKAIKDQLIDHGSVTRGQLGIIIQDITPDLASMFDLKNQDGIIVAQVMAGSPAEKGGLKSGDIILKLDGKPVKAINSFRNKIAMTAPGTEKKLTILRNGQEQTFSVTIGSQGDAAWSGGEGKELEKLGLQIEPLTDALAERLGYTEKSGVLVSKVVPGSPADEAGIRSGALILAVNQQNVATVADFKRMIASSPKKALLLVKQAGYSNYVVLKWE